MSKQPKPGSGNMLLLAGLGVGAFMLFGNRNKATVTDVHQGGGEDIPDAPKILAINNAGTESPLPTGIVSDEEGMETTSSSASRQTTTAEAQEEDSDDTSSGIVPPLISTKLTPKEKTIISKGVLSNDLAIQRPDLYKAIYIKKHGGKGNGQKALQAADAIISRIQTAGITAATSSQKKKRRVAIRLHPQAGSMVKAAKTASTGVVRTGTKTVKAANHASAIHQPAGKHPAATRSGSKRAHTQHKAAPHPAAKKRTASPQRRPVHR